MKKKLLAMILVGTMVLSLAACGSTKTPVVESDTAAETGAETDAAETSEESTGGYELALVTDLGTIDDKSFNQGSWEGLAQYAEEFGKTYKYYQPQEATTDSYVETIGLAIEGGAKVIVCPGFLFETPVYIVQELYPDVSFILLDGEPHNEDYSDFATATNTMAILYQEDQPGYLAGYASVKDGMTKLGFMGGMAVPAVVRFGYGFVQGADAAAEEMGVDVDVMYHYTGEFAATPEAQAMAASWYQNGTEVIFGCGGAVGNSVMAAAEEANAKVIGVDVDQSYESDTVITSAMKKLSVSVYDGIKAYYEGNFPGGSTSIFSAKNDGIGLPMETSKFENFTQDDYNTILAGLVDGSIVISNDVSDTTTADITLSSAKVTFVE